jgi:hypothetical protein
VKASDQLFTRREFVEALGLGSVVALDRLAADEAKGGPMRNGSRWQLPLRITERAGVAWHGERISVGVVVPAHCAVVALRLKDEQTGRILSCGAGYARRTSGGHLRWCQLSFPLHLAPHEQASLILELLEDSQAPGAVVPAAPGDETIQNLDLSVAVAGIRWQSNPKLGELALVTIDGSAVTEEQSAWCQLAVADLSAPEEMIGGYLPLEAGEVVQLFQRVTNPHLTVVDLQRTIQRGAYGAGYELRQIQLYDLPGEDMKSERPYALCDAILLVHAGKDGIPLEVDGMALLLGSTLQKEFIWQARGDAEDPLKRLRGPWQQGLRLAAGDWMMTIGESGRSMLVIPWSAYTLDGYDLSYLVGQTHAAPRGSKARDGLAVALARGKYRINWGWGAGGEWGRNTYEFRCRIAWGAVDESTAERLARAYRLPPRVEVGEPEPARSALALRCWPERFTYAPGEKVSVEIEAVAEAKGQGEASEGETAEVIIRHRGKTVGEPSQVALRTGSDNRLRGVLSWTAPESAAGGYVFSARLPKRKAMIEAPPVPVEVLRRPADLSRQVRLATICELYADRDAEVLADRLVDARINVAWLRNVFHFGQYTGPADGSWYGAEGCMASDIGRPIRVHGAHLRRFIQACRARGITTIVYGNLRNLQESYYEAAALTGTLGPDDVDLSDRRWPFPDDEVNYRGLAGRPRWEQYLIHQITDGMERFGYDGYFFDNTSFGSTPYISPDGHAYPEAELAHRVIAATRLARPDQFIIENPGPPPRQDLPKGWGNTRDPEIIRWPEVGCALMEQQSIDSVEGIVAYARFYRDVDDTKTPVMYMNDPTRRSPTTHVLRMGHLLAGKATDDLCVGNSTHDGGVFFEQCPVSAALTRTFYGALASHPELLEPGSLLEGVKVEGLDKATTLAYDALSAGGRARTLVIANHTGWEAPLRNVGYYWDGSKPTIQPAQGVIVTIPVPPQRRIEGCWLVRPEGWTPVPWKLAGPDGSIRIEIGEVAELAAVVVRW